MLTTHPRRAVGIFPSRREAELALTELRDAGFPMSRVSVIAKDRQVTPSVTHQGVHLMVTDTPVEHGAVSGATAGGALGGITGLLVGLGAIALPGFGPIILGGAAATVLATTLAGGALGAAAGSLIGALISVGIPEERARIYSDRIARGEYLVMMDGMDPEIAQAERILGYHGIQDWGVYDMPLAESRVADRRVL